MKYTKYLGLKKPESTNFYDIDDFNYNADRIDEELGNIELDANDILNKIKTVDGEGSGLDADTLDGKDSTAFAASDHKHEMEDINKLNLTAENTTVKDTDNNFVSGTVEGALNELATKDKALDKRIVNNKEDIDRLKLSVADGKSKIATSVSGKGVPTNGSDSFQQMADNIDSIKTKLPILEGDVGVTEDSEGNVYGVIEYDYRQKYIDPNNPIELVWEVNSGGCVEVDAQGYVHTVNSKYDSDGNLIWTISDISYINYIAVDSKCNTYVAYGSAGNSAGVAKYDFEGKLIWNCSLSSGLVSCVVVNSQGYVYAVNGSSLYKINSEGELLKSYSTNLRNAFFLVLDKDDNLYVSQEYSSNQSGVVRIFDSNLNLIKDWFIPYLKRAVIDNDFLYVCTDNSRTIAKYDISNGLNKIWELPVDYAVFIAVDKQSCVYIASNNARKYDLGLNIKWKYSMSTIKHIYLNEGYVYFSNGSWTGKFKDNYVLEKMAVLKERGATK